MSDDIELVIKIKDVITNAVRGIDNDRPGRIASVIGSACWYALDENAKDANPSAAMVGSAFGFDQGAALVAAAHFLDPDGKIRELIDSDHEHKPEPYGDGEWAKCSVCGDDGFPVTFDAAYGLPPNTSRVVQDQMHTAELLRLLRAYHAGADRGELKAMLDRAWGAPKEDPRCSFDGRCTTSHRADQSPDDPAGFDSVDGGAQ